MRNYRVPATARFDGNSLADDAPDYTVEDGVIVDPGSDRDETSRTYRRFWETAFDAAPSALRDAWKKHEEAQWAARSGPVFTRRIEA